MGGGFQGVFKKANEDKHLGGIWLVVLRYLVVVKNGLDFFKLVKLWVKRLFKLLDFELPLD